MFCVCSTCVYAKAGCPDACNNRCTGSSHLFGENSLIVKCTGYEKISNNTTSIPAKLIKDAVNSEKAPPKGVKPYFIAGGDRICDLAQAIERSSDCPKGNLSTIRNWATEIIAQCDLIEKLEGKHEQNKLH